MRRTNNRSRATEPVVVSERQIEDILAIYTDLLAELLGVPPPLRILERQMMLPQGGRLDLLCSSGQQLLLIELKVEPARKEFVSQVRDYAAQLPVLQAQGALPEGEIQSYLMVPGISEKLVHLCKAEGIHPVVYDPRHILHRFFTEFRGRMVMLGIAPHNHGVWHLGVIHPLLHALAQTGAADASSLSAQTGLSQSTIRSYLTLSEQLGVIQRGGNGYQLTSTGQLYQQGVERGNRTVSEEQAALLRGHILKQPFSSGATFGIFTVVENVMTLARNSYPVLMETLSDYFTLSVGNQSRWRYTKTRLDATRMYVEYAAQLGLLARVGEQVYLTPEGVRFTLLLQLHKAIHLLDALQIPAP